MGGDSLTQKYSKKNIIITIILLCVVTVFSVWLYLDNNRIDITELEIENELIPDSFDGFTIVQVSDLHNTEFGKDNEKLVNAIKSVEPDLIAITGDLMDSKHTDVDVAISFIEQTATLAPVYFITGNHEYSNITEYNKLEDSMKKAGIHILANESAYVKKNGETIQIIGLDDPIWSDLYSIEGAIENKITDNLRSLKAPDLFCFVLSHRPEYFDAYCQSNVDLVLSGHAHGGQYRLPFIGGLIAPNQGLFPKYTEGAYEKDGTTMIVSRGLGNSILPFRLNNPPELVVIKLSTL